MPIPTEELGSYSVTSRPAEGLSHQPGGMNFLGLGFNA
jgi:hypothetical protein